MQNRTLILLLLVWMLAACAPAPSAPTATQTARSTYTAAPSATGTSTDTPEPTATATATPKEYQVLPDAPLVVSGFDLDKAPTLIRDQLPAARADILKMYGKGIIPNFTSDVVFMDLRYMAGKNVKGGPDPIAIWFNSDKNKQRAMDQNADARQVKVVATFNDGSGGAWLANLWEGSDKSVSVFWYHLVPPFSDDATLENEIQKTIDQTNQPTQNFVLPTFMENESDCAAFSPNVLFCNNYLAQSEARIKAFKDWVANGKPPQEFQDGSIDLVPALDHIFML